MLNRLNKIFDGVLHRSQLRRIQRWAQDVPAMDFARLRQTRKKARELQRGLERTLQRAEGRLALPLIGSDLVDAPLHSDWTYRPELWRLPVSPPGLAGVANETRFGAEAVVFHNCDVSELTLRQIRNHLDEDLAPFGVNLDVFRFDGSFLSLVVELPQEAVAGLKRRHLVRFAAQIDYEHPLEVFVRLNVRHGPNTEQLVRELPLGETDVAVDFDLAYSNLNERRIERAWVDIIFEGPDMNQIYLRDVTLSRRPRAEI